MKTHTRDLSPQVPRMSGSREGHEYRIIEVAIWSEKSRRESDVT